MQKQFFPSIQLNSEQLAEVKDWVIGEQYKLEVTVELTGKRQPDNWEIEEGSRGQLPKDSQIGSFNIIDVTCDCDNDETMSTSDVYESDYAKNRSRS